MEGGFPADVGRLGVEALGTLGRDSATSRTPDPTAVKGKVSAAIDAKKEGTSARLVPDKGSGTSEASGDATRPVQRRYHKDGPHEWSVPDNTLPWCPRRYKSDSGLPFQLPICLEVSASSAVCAGDIRIGP
eukprot:TRINITY_DN6363_c0_g1_i1.p4 TRINITY_DN6363_c0_g1~~TRINITY_DN6363_c0_g1_i1.p4  ORF type:complete len:131 (+),score=8.76 TRINITY_DN6363_c0_g1_i1:1055-1447(+)